MKHNRLSIALVGAVIILAATALPVAAEPLPPGVVADAVVTVSVGNAADSTPVSAALVQLEVRQADDVVAAWYGPSTDDGTITFANVWRPDSTGPALEWHAVAYWSRSTYGADAGLPANCRVTQSIFGTAGSAAAEGGASLAIAGEPASSAVCGPTLHGTALDAAGNAFSVETAYLSATDEEGHVWEIPFTVAPSGEFSALAPPVFEASVFVRSTTTRTEIEGGCSYSYAQVVSQAISVNGDSELALVGAEERILGSCTATPKPTEAGGGEIPKPTAEPTEAGEGNLPDPTAAATDAPDGGAVLAPTAQPTRPAGGALPNSTPPFTGGAVPGLTPPATDVNATATAAAAPLEFVLALIGLATLITFVLVPRGRVREVRQTQ